VRKVVCVGGRSSVRGQSFTTDARGSLAVRVLDQEPLLVSESDALEFAKASLSSPFASRPWRSVTVVVTAVLIADSVVVTVVTAPGTLLKPDTPLMALSIVSTSC
jgi:hypothetical protein